MSALLAGEQPEVVLRIPWALLSATAGLCACSRSDALLGDSEFGLCPSKALVQLGCCKSSEMFGATEGAVGILVFPGTSQSRGQAHRERGECLEEPALFSCSAGPRWGLVPVKILPQVQS